MPYRFLPLLLLAAIAPVAAAAGEDHTSFQTAGPYKPGLDIASDQVMVYGVNPSFASRLDSWRAQGYHAGFMTGISWGGYEAYYGADERRVREEIQTDASGKRFMHGQSDTVGYNVPTPEYLSFLKDYLNPAIDAGIESFYLEEPEYWARTGWSEGFKRAWRDYYGEAWEAPDSSVAAQFKASRLKYELYYNALSEIFGHIKERAASQGRTAKCYVPTHSMINYAHWRIVSPESRLMDLDIADGYIAQVWTGTARTPNRYQGVRKERTFETAFIEYGQMLSMVRPTGRTVWFLADPVEDNPNHTWTDYEYNYKLTLAASLFWPEVYQYEVLPWPDRIFEGRYPVEGSEEKATISPAYTAQLLAIFNALNHMKQDDIALDAGTGGIGLIVSDTLMFQRGDPHPSDPDLAPVYALALPLLKHGVPVAPVQLETVLTPGALDAFSVLLLTYEGQKPLRADYHEILAGWVRAGGALILVGDGADPYHAVPEWWNKRGAAESTPYDDLLDRLGAPEPASKPTSVGQGQLIRLDAAPAALQADAAGAERIREAVRLALAARDKPLKTQHYLRLRRGPYVVAMGLDESLNAPPHVLSGPFIDLFDPELPLLPEKVLHPGTPALLYDLEWASANTPAPAVAAASTRVRGEMAAEGGFQCTTRGPAGTAANVIVRLPRRPVKVTLDPPAAVEQAWDAERGILRLHYENQAAEIRLALTF
ncbi:MAG: hypothetical protein KF886_22455 [Candidatus Hydrogenedentes bacterium]|nr:hypothetical protein [Candidatus Hydrogenedentota bacterium]